MDGAVPGFGLMAVVDIAEGEYLAETASSASSDPVKAEGVSVMMINGKLYMVLGELRFANHDCNPNAQVSSSVLSALGAC